MEIHEKDIPRAKRLAEDEHLFKTHPQDPLIVPDRVSPSIEGYFRIPAIWVGETPAPESVKVLDPLIHHAKVFRADLKCGIKVEVQRDGFFLFDFSNWPLAPMVIIPGYRSPATYPHYPTVEHGQAQNKAEEYAVLRAQVMNVHQVCLTTAESIVKRRGAAMGVPVTAWNTHKAITFDTAPSYHDDTENIHALAKNVLNNKDRVKRDRHLERRTIELDVIRCSFELLDKILLHEDPQIIHLVEAAYIATCRNGEKRYGEALTLAWGACEQLISAEWKGLLEDHAKKDSQNMSSDRKKKLYGRDYTASVMVEMLEVSGRISKELYRKLEIARKARNNWAHEMRPPKQSEVSICLQAVQSMLMQTKGVRIVLQLSSRGGVPEWPYWMWDQLKNERAKKN